MHTFKDFNERYCPYIRGNVPVEVTYSETGSPTQQCLNSFRCPRQECSIFIHKVEQLTLYKRNSLEK